MRLELKTTVARPKEVTEEILADRGGTSGILGTLVLFKLVF